MIPRTASSVVTSPLHIAATRFLTATRLCVTTMCLCSFVVPYRISLGIQSSSERLDAQAAMRSGTTKEHQHTQIVAEGESKSVSEPLRMEQRDRNEVIHEALAEEVRRGEQRKKRSDRAAVECQKQTQQHQNREKIRLNQK